MERREFLKNSIGALLYVGLTSNKVLASVVKSTPNDSMDVLLYLIQTKKGDWKVKGTKWTDLKSSRLSRFHYNLETFKPLEIVDNKIANNIKEKYWNQYNCKGKCPKNVNYLSSYKSGLNAKESGQLFEASKKSLGKSHQMYPEYWKEHGKRIGNLNKKNGHLKMLHEVYGKNLGKRYGKLGADKVVREKLGIHSATKEKRKEWASIGGKIGGRVKAMKYDMKEFSKLGQAENIRKYGVKIFANNLYTFEVKEFDSLHQAQKYCNVQRHIINNIINGNQPKTRSGWVFNKK